MGVGILLNGQNPLSVTKVICWWSLISFYRFTLYSWLRFFYLLSSWSRDVSREVLLPIDQYGIPNSYPKLIKTKNLKVILNQLSSTAMFNLIGKYEIITFSTLNNPESSHPHMFKTENYSSKFTIDLLGSCSEIPYWKRYSQKISGYITVKWAENKN